MRLFSGLEHTDYQDVLRAIGLLYDRRDWHNLRLVECEEGIILQYTETSSGRDFKTYLYSDEDVQTVLREAYAQRGRLQPPGNAPA